MRRRQAQGNEERREIEVQRRTAADDALALRETYPPEEFAGFGDFGEFPEWHPGQAECDEDHAS
jgi:hypothetical protein